MLEQTANSKTLRINQVIKFITDFEILLSNQVKEIAMLVGNSSLSPTG
jgi:hypothetical protein